MKKNYSLFSLYAYLSVVSDCCRAAHLAPGQGQHTLVYHPAAVTLLGLGSLVPITSRIELISRVFGN